VRARRFRRDRDPGQGAYAPARPLPEQGVRGRADRGVLDLCVVLRDLPVHDAVPPADPRALPDPGRARLSAVHRVDLPGLRDERLAAREGLGGRTDRPRGCVFGDWPGPPAARAGAPRPGSSYPPPHRPPPPEPPPPPPPPPPP